MNIKSPVIRFSVLGVLALFILLLSMLEPFQFTGWKWVIFALSTPIVFVAGWNFHLYAFQAAKRLEANMNTLVSIGTISAWIWSVASLFRDTSLYFETAAIVIIIILFGNWLEQHTLTGTRNAISKLGQLIPKNVLLEDGTTISITQLTPSMRFRAREGEYIAADGVVVEGQAALDTSMLTGESLNRQVFVGDEVIGSTIVTKGTLVIEATHTGDATFHSHILKLVEQTQQSQVPIQKMVDRVSGIFSYIVLGIAFLATSIWLLLGNPVVDGLEAGVSVLLIACPCALGLATPIAIMAAAGRGAELGIVLKNTNILETVKNIDIVALDKTGTLTSGQILIRNIVMDSDAVVDGDAVVDSSSNDMTQEGLLDIAVALETHSTHPIGVAITNAYFSYSSEDKDKDSSKNRDDPYPVSSIEVENVQNHIGMGVTATIKAPQNLKAGNLKTRNLKAGIGKPELFQEVPKELLATANQTKANGDIAVFCGIGETNGIGETTNENTTNGVSTNGLIARGVIILSDKLRPEADIAIQELKKLNIKTVMITGDSQRSAELLAGQLGIEEVHAEVLPDQKAALIQKLQARNSSNVLMVGDGTNDAAALTTANLSIAIGSGTEIAIESADIALLGKDLRGIVDALLLARKTRSTIATNLFWAFFYNAAAIPLAAIGLLTPIIAAAAMSFSSLFVVLNSVRLRRFKRLPVN